MKHINSCEKKGFTLIELMIVIAILGFLIVAGLSSFMISMKKSRDSKRKNDLRQIATSLEAYQNDYNTYPLSDANGAIVGCDVSVNPVCEWGEAFKDVNGTVYMTILPDDPISGQRYFYKSTDGTQFQLYARLENTLDSDIPKNGDDEPRAFSAYNCAEDPGTVYCNYGVASSNVSPIDGTNPIYE